jgi:hypothetical protein
MRIADRLLVERQDYFAVRNILAGFDSFPEFGKLQLPTVKCLLVDTQRTSDRKRSINPIFCGSL